MSAFFSSQDDSDDRSSINFSGVVGNIKDNSYSSVWRFNYTSKKFKAEFSDIFEVPKVQAPAIPDGWLDKVKTPAVTTYKYQGKQQGGPNSMLPVHPNVGRGGHHRQGNGVPIGGVTPGSGMGFIPTDSFLMQASDEEIDQAFGLSGKRGGTQKKAQGNGAAIVDRCPTQEDQAVIDGAEGEGWAGTESFSQQYQCYMKEMADMYPWNHPQNPFDHSLNKVTDVPTEVTKEVVEGLRDQDVQEVHGEHIPDEAGLYEMHVTEYGPDIADAYDEVSEGMSIIAGQDDLMLELISDMVGLLSPDKASAVISGIGKVSVEIDPTQCRDVATELFGLLPEDVQAETFKDLYHQLPKAIKDRIANFGF